MSQNYADATMFFYLLAAHALCDFSLQSDFIAKFKSRHAKSDDVIWPYVLLAHALMHGAAVAVITQSLKMGVLETLAHAAIDFAKCEKWIDFHDDQMFHFVCKFAWIAFL